MQAYHTWLGDNYGTSLAHFNRLFPTNENSFDEFRKWANDNELIHLHTNDSFYTWNNGRKDRDYATKNLIGVFVTNYGWNFGRP